MRSRARDVAQVPDPGAGPPSYRDPRDPLPATAHHLRPAVLDRYDQDVGDRVPIEGELRQRRPTVYFTLGTVFHREAGDLFTRVLAGLRDLAFDVVSVGREIDPNEHGNVPSTVRVERFVPQANVLTQCNVVVSHAGSGTVIGALAYGLPSVLLPNALEDPSYGVAAGRMRDEIDSLPDSEYAAYLLERLAIDRSPLVKHGS